MSISSVKRGRLFFSAAIISMSMFMFEVILSRLFSVILAYHFVFLIVSLAVLGLGIGSILEYWLQESESVTESRIQKGILYLLVSMFCSFALIYFLPYSSPILYMFLSIIPFVFTGRLMAIFFRSYSEYARKIYFSDMVGAGLAALISMTLFDSIGFIQTVLVVMGMIVFVNLLWQRSKVGLYSTASLILLVLLTLGTQLDQVIEKNFI